jgi:hypothetical protein
MKDKQIASTCLKEEQWGGTLTSHPKEDNSCVLGTHIGDLEMFWKISKFRASQKS